MGETETIDNQLATESDFDDRAEKLRQSRMKSIEAKKNSPGGDLATKALEATPYGRAFKIADKIGGAFGIPVKKVAIGCSVLFFSLFSLILIIFGYFFVHPFSTSWLLIKGLLKSFLPTKDT